MDNKGQKRRRASSGKTTVVKRINQQLSPSSCHSEEKFKMEDTFPTVKEGDNKELLTSMVGSLKDLHSKFDSFKCDQDKLNNDIYDTDGLCERVGRLEEDCGDNGGTIADLWEDNKNLRYELQLIKAVVVKQNEHIEMLHNMCIDSQARSMRCNVLFHNVPEQKGEIAEQIVCGILKDIGLTDPVKFEIVHRIGAFKVNPSPKSPPRPMVAKLHSLKDVDKILKMGKDLPREDGKQLLRITPQYPQELVEKRRYLMGQADREKEEKGGHINIRLAHDTLYINGEKFKEKVCTPKPKDILYMTDEELENIDKKVKLYQGDMKTLDGSTFVANTAEVKNLEEVRMGYKKLLHNPSRLKSTHNIAVYRIYDPTTSKTISGFQDDGEHGAGRYLLKYMEKRQLKNVVAFVTRQYGGKHLGYQRFELMRDCVSSALEKMKNA